MPVAKEPLIFSTTGSFTFQPAPGDRDIFIGISPTVPGSTANVALGSTGPTASATQQFSGLQFQLFGQRNSGITYDIALFTSDYAGPLAGPVSPPNNASIAYIASIAAFSKVSFNVLALNGGAVTVELLTGSFFDSPPARLIGAGGTMTVNGAVTATIPGMLLGSAGLQIATPEEDRMNKMFVKLLAKIGTTNELLTRWLGSLPTAQVLDPEPDRIEVG